MALKNTPVTADRPAPPTGPRIANRFVRVNTTNSRLDKGKGMRRPTITIDHWGTFRINRVAAQMMGLEVGHRVELLHDPDAHEWYLHTHTEEGFAVHQDSNTAISFRSSIAARRVIASLQDGQAIGRCVIGATPEEVNGGKAWAILLSSSNKLGNG